MGHSKTQPGGLSGLRVTLTAHSLSSKRYPCVTRALILQPPGALATSDCGLHSCLCICGLLGGSLGLLDTYLCLTYRCSLPMPLPQRTHPRWEMLSLSSFFKTWKVLESCLEFGVCDIGRETHFPRGIGTCIKWVMRWVGKPHNYVQLRTREEAESPGTSQRSCAGLTRLSSSGLRSRPAHTPQAGGVNRTGKERFGFDSS